MFDHFSLSTVLVSYVALLFSLSVHEASHATVAYALEDDTARNQGRMTLNPLAHIDLVGTVIFPLIGMSTGIPIIGWAKPVPVDPRHLTRRFHARVGMAFVAFAGPASNFLQCMVFLPLLAVLIRSLTPPDVAYRMDVFKAAMFAPVDAFMRSGSLSVAQILGLTLLGRLVVINMALALFNLLPVGPLDGGAIARGFLPYTWLPTYDRMQPYIGIGLLVLFFFGLLGLILGPLFYVAEHYVLFPLARLYLGG